MSPLEPDQKNPSYNTALGANEPTEHAKGPSEGSERWLRAAVQNSSDFVMILEADATIRYTSPAVERVLGYRPEDFVGTIALDYVHPEDLEYMSKSFAEAVEKPGVQPPIEYRARTADGSWRHMEAIRSNWLEDPDVAGVVANVRDVTDRKEIEERFRSLVQNSADVITVVDADGTILYDSPAVERVLGYKPEERVGTNAFDYIGPSELEQVTRMLEELLASPGARLTGEMWWPHKDGSFRYLEVTPTNLLEDPAVGGIVVNWRDITDRKEAEEALKESEQRLRTIIGNVPVVLFAMDQEGVFTLSEGKGLEILGLRPGEVVGRSVFEVYRDVPEILEQARRTLDGEEVSTTVEVGELVFESFYRPLRDEGGEVIGLIGVAANVTEHKWAEKRLKYLAFYDLLTDLPNRQLFMDRLKQALRRTKRRRRGGRKVGVLFMDLDNFKVVNDSLGHEMGDRLLMAVGERLSGCLRPEDTLARFGGDEFTVLIENVEDPADAVRVAERIIVAFREPLVLEGRELFVKPSIGISLGTARTTSPEYLLRDADTAMYQAKKEGLGYMVFEPVMYEQALRRLKMENELQRAIESEEFVVHYQPIIDLRSDEEVWGVEALVRWQHPERGLLDPKEFIPAAEESGLVVPMGERVLKEACEQAKEWQERNPHVPPLVIAVNLSARQLGRPDLFRTVEGVLKETGLEGCCLSLDITETIYVKTLEANTATLNELKRMGVRISIDDFGTGYSSLAYLKRLPADALKIDKSFIRALGEEVEDTVLVQMIINLAHTFGMEVIAEGVESEVQAEQLKDMGCDLGQGYYFAKPLPPEAASGFLAR